MIRHILVIILMGAIFTVSCKPWNIFDLAASGNAEKLETHIKKCPELINLQRKHDGDTPLHIAVEENHLESAGVLIAGGAEVNIQARNGQTPLHLAVKNRNKELASLLIENGADFYIRDHFHYTPLHWSAVNNDKDMAEFLIIKGAEVNYYDTAGNTPLTLALKKNNREVADLLRTYGGAKERPISKKVQEICKAASERNIEQLKSLLTGNPELINARSYGYNTPLHCAVQMALEKMAESIPAGQEQIVVEYLVSHGAEVNVRNDNRMTPLHLASLSGDLSSAQVLIKNGADVNARNNENSTPLHLATSPHRGEMAELLLNNGADLKAVNKKGRTPLEASWQYKDNPVTEIIRKKIREGHN